MLHCKNERKVRFHDTRRHAMSQYTQTTLINHSQLIVFCPTQLYGHQTMCES